jgi:hypothetical protein
MKSAPVISSNFLQRIADPALQFHPNYLWSRNLEITKRHSLILDPVWNFLESYTPLKRGVKENG